MQIVSAGFVLGVTLQQHENDFAVTVAATCTDNSTGAILNLSPPERRQIAAAILKGMGLGDVAHELTDLGAH